MYSAYPCRGELVIYMPISPSDYFLIVSKASFAPFEGMLDRKCSRGTFHQTSNVAGASKFPLVLELGETHWRKERRVVGRDRMPSRHFECRH